jgi:hypothetical protein
MGIRRNIRLFRDSRFLRFLRADTVRGPRHRSPLAKPRFWHHVFDIPRFRVWYKCNRDIRGHGALGDKVVLYLPQWEGWVRMEPFLGFFHQSSNEPCPGREARSHFRHILTSARFARRCSACCAWPATCFTASRSRRSLLFLHAPREAGQ